MAKFLKSPIARYKDEPIYITLKFGDKTYVEAYKKLGWNLAFHNGLDCVNSQDLVKAYGSPVLSTQDGVVQKVIWDSSLSTKGNGITIEGTSFIDKGEQLLLCELHWHLADVLVKAGDFVKAGQRIGSLGNSGFSIGGTTSPMKGTHDHFGVFTYILKDGKWQLKYPDNGVQGADDPLNYLEDNWRENAPIYETDKLSHLGGILEIIKKTLNWIKGR